MVRIGSLWGNSVSPGEATQLPAPTAPDMALPPVTTRCFKSTQRLREPAISRRFAEIMVHQGSTAYTDHGAVAKLLQHLRYLGAQGGDHGAAYAAASRALAGGMDLWYRQSTEVSLRVFASVCTAGATLLPSAKQLACWHLGKHVLQQVQHHGQALILNGLPAHATLTQIIQEPTGGYTLKIFNSGLGNAHHTGRPDAGRNKHQSMFEVRNIPAAQLTAREIGRMLAMRGIVSTYSDRAISNRICQLYVWASAQGEVHNPPTAPVHALQKGNTCAYKCVLAYLRNTLSDAAFTHCMAQLYTHAAHTHQRRRPRARLTQTLQRQADHARHKAAAAAYRAHVTAQARQASWFYQSADRAQVRHTVRQAADRTGRPAFALLHCPDTRQMALVTAEPQSDTQQTPIEVVFQNETPRLQILAPHLAASTYTTLQEICDQATTHHTPIDTRSLAAPTAAPQAMAATWQAQGNAWAPQGYVGQRSSMAVHHLLNKHAQSRTGVFALRYDAGQQAFVATAQQPTRRGRMPRRTTMAFDLDPYTGQARARSTGAAFNNFAHMFNHAHATLCTGTTPWTPVSQ